MIFDINADLRFVGTKTITPCGLLLFNIVAEKPKIGAGGNTIEFDADPMKRKVIVIDSDDDFEATVRWVELPTGVKSPKVKPVGTVKASTKSKQRIRNRDSELDDMVSQGSPVRELPVAKTRVVNCSSEQDTTTTPAVSLRALLDRSSRSSTPRLESRAPKSNHVRPVPVASLPPPFGNEFVMARWPQEVVHLRDHFNPNGVGFAYAGDFGMCHCDLPCRTDSCRNARLGIFCTIKCCVFGGCCGNSLRLAPELCLARNKRTRELAVVATGQIDCGVILAEYLGKLQATTSSCSSVRNTGYRLKMRADATKSGRVFIDAEKFGSIVRFMNHSCNPAADFYQLSNGYHHTIVAVSCRVIEPGEEVTVHYGDDLWFVCRCGHSDCCHRFIQDQDDP